MKEKIMAIFRSISCNSDSEWVFVDDSIVKAHQLSTGASKNAKTAIGKSVAGNTRKVHMVVDSFGLLIHFETTGGHVHYSMLAPDIVSAVSNAEHVIGDRGYGIQALRVQIDAQGATAVIPGKSNSKTPNDDMDWGLLNTGIW